MTFFRTNKLPPSNDKLSGRYFTPPEIATFLCQWAIRTGSETVLEPSCGNGRFVEAALSQAEATGGRSAKLTIVGVDIGQDDIEATRRISRRHKSLHKNSKFVCQDFFAFYSELPAQSKFDVVIGNPPFIRFQNFDTGGRDLAFDGLRRLGFHPTKLANAWAAFVHLSISLVRDGGRLAMALPAELLQVQYAAELREQLAAVFDDIILIGFDELVFPEIQQEIVLVLADGKRTAGSQKSAIHTVALKNELDLKRITLDDIRVEHLPKKHSRKGMKWTSLFLDDAEFDAIDSVEADVRIPRLGDFANVDVGVVTGRNAFFVITKQLARAIDAERFCIPVVGKTSALRSVKFGMTDFSDFEQRFPSMLLNLKDVSHVSFSKGLVDYIRQGEAAGVHSGYKCRIRKRWYDVPSVYVPDAFLFRQIHTAAFLVLNNVRATSTDTVHRVRFKTKLKNRAKFCAASVNSLTFAWAEVAGRSYGGGVLELEPNEAEQLPWPTEGLENLDAKKVDRLVREGKLESALDYVDDVLLRKGLGISKEKLRLIRSAWRTLRERRRNRRG